MYGQLGRDDGKVNSLVPTDSHLAEVQEKSRN